MLIRVCLQDEFHGSMMTVMEKMDYAMSPETVIVGDTLSQFRCTNKAQGGISVAVALVFAVDRNKPPGIGETQFHAILSSGLSPVGPTYKATSVIEKDDYETWIAARREGSDENIDGETILNRVYDEVCMLLSEFQGLPFIFIPIFRRCPLCSKLTSFVLYVFISYTFCPLGLTQLVFSVKFGHVLCT
ncbi:hypothetical protein HanIR_Chr02g0055651 [Helianthus annuus]|nr:hypothetical protein HanIR_Chr02g0055651 [Helianthus annuus]